MKDQRSHGGSSVGSVVAVHEDVHSQMSVPGLLDLGRLHKV